MDNYKVYVHISPSNKYYVGITKQNIKNRWKNGSSYKQNSHFYNAIKKYGWDNFQHEVIAENLSKDEACNFEKILIKKLNSNNREFGYNKSVGGEHGGSGAERSKESLKRTSDSLKGHHVSTETRRKISNSRTGLKQSEETKNKISKTLTGHKMSIETRKKMSQNAKKRVSTHPNAKCVKRPILQYDLNMNFIREWSSIMEATIGLGFKSHGCIDNVLSGRSKQTHGFIFRYKNTV